MIHQIRRMMEKSPKLKGLVAGIRGSELMQRRRDYLGRKNWEAEVQRSIHAFQVYYAAHEGEFHRLSEMLADDFSRETLRAVLSYRLKRTLRKDGNVAYREKMLGKVVVQPQYFQKDIFGPAEDEVFVDGGAYVGDTIQDLVQFGGGHAYWKKVYAWEPDALNQERLKDACKDLENIEIVPCGLWSERGELHFDIKGSDETCVSDRGTQILKVDTIDNVCSGDRITFIKMDIEGSEQEALRGAEEVIRRDKPRLAICIYHRPEDFIEIPRMLKEMVPGYKFYIRHHSLEWPETVLYAVPPTEEVKKGKGREE